MHHLLKTLLCQIIVVIFDIWWEPGSKMKKDQTWPSPVLNISTLSTKCRQFFLSDWRFWAFLLTFGFFCFSKEQVEVFLKGLNFERVSQQFIKSHVPVLSYKLGGWKVLVAQRILVHSLDLSFTKGTHGLGLYIQIGVMATCRERHNV